MKATTHLKAIDEAIQELGAFHSRTADPAPIPHQYVGTIIDNTLGLLTAPANSLDDGNRNINFDAFQNWLSLMQAVHRSFFSSIQMATELGLDHLCNTHGVAVSSRQGTKLLEKVQKVQQAASGANLQLRELDDLAKHFASYRPVFNDYLEAIFKCASLTKETKKQWRSFFKALSIARNKVSHSHPSLSESERADLVAGGCSVMIAGNGSLVVNPRMYAQVADFVLQFFDILYGALPADEPSRVEVQKGQ